MKKLLLVLLLSSAWILTPATAEASNDRLDSLSLNANDYWIVPDPLNLFSNPAYINVYPQSLSITAADRAGDHLPVGTFTVRLDDKSVFGLTLGYPHPSFYNVYASLNPGHVFQDFSSLIEIEEGDVFLVPAAGEIDSDNLTLHFGYLLNRTALGLSASYIALDSSDITEGAPAGSLEIRTTAHRNIRINLGALIDAAGVFDTIAFNFGAEYPYLTRKYAEVTPTSSDHRGVDGNDAWSYRLGFAGNASTSARNTVTFGFDYAAANFHCLAFEHLDADGDGDFADPGDVWLEDTFLTQRYSIRYGLADRLTLDRGFIFLSIYGHIYKYKQYAAGYTNGVPYDSSVNKSNRFTVPVIFGGEMNLTDWLIVRLSATKDIVSFTKWYDETTGTTYTDYTSSEGKGAVNAGLGLRFQSLAVDWSLKSPWSGPSDPLASDFNDSVTAKLSLTWEF